MQKLTLTSKAPFLTLIIKNKKLKNITKQINISYCLFHFFTLSNAKHGERIVIGLAASSTSKGPQVKTTEPMDSIKVTHCSIQLG